VAFTCPLTGSKLAGGKIATESKLKRLKKSYFF